MIQAAPLALMKLSLMSRVLSGLVNIAVYALPVPLLAWANAPRRTPTETARQ